MNDFWADLARHLAAYEAGEADAEWWDGLEPDWRELSVDPEERDLVGEWDVQPENEREASA